MAQRSFSPDYVEYVAPDIFVEKTRPFGPDWLRLKPGFQYAGQCTNKDCVSHRGMAVDVGWVLCHRGVGTFRPSEDADFRKIRVHYFSLFARCPACQTAFASLVFYFYQCSARIRFHIEGQAAKIVELPQSADGEYLVYGEASRMITYTSLIIDCRTHEEQNIPTTCSDQSQIFGSERGAAVAA